jgi:hypothetical protein
MRSRTRPPASPSRRSRRPRLELVGVHEAAELLGISKAALADRRRSTRFRTKPEFPEPIVELACGPIWLKRDVEEYRRRWDAAGSHHADASRWSR